MYKARKISKFYVLCRFSISCALRRDSSRVARALSKGRNSFWHLRVAQDCMARRAGLSGSVMKVSDGCALRIFKWRAAQIQVFIPRVAQGGWR
ncbi:hypothetical protein A2U01_0070703, partial [Trifolium medium]|nr:hypothetical protein [Trifolium medium]